MDIGFQFLRLHVAGSGRREMRDKRRGEGRGEKVIVTQCVLKCWHQPGEKEDEEVGVH